tara:strand:- start:11446 stop:12069 length:624 start_codon:yes stop_codon:yes gene_type:complete
MKVNFFDLGSYMGVEADWMVSNIFPMLGITDYNIYCFEACRKYAKRLTKIYESNQNVEVINKAVVDKPGTIKLYYSPNRVGHSVFSTKNNVTSEYEEVEGIVFSDWVKENVEDYEKSFNVLKVNIEGAEWYLFNDLFNSGLHKEIDIYCGQGHDLHKIGELEDKIQEYYTLLEENGVHLHRFTEFRPHQNVDLYTLIKEKMENYENS